MGKRYPQRKTLVYGTYRSSWHKCNIQPNDTEVFRNAATSLFVYVDPTVYVTGKTEEEKNNIGIRSR